jgi:hypothetical protein
MTPTRILILIFLAYCCGVAFSQTNSPSMIGSWNVEITLGQAGNPNTEVRHKLRFDAQNDGKGSLVLLDPLAMHWQGAKPSEGKWTRGDGNNLTFSGPVEFPLGNVGRDPGTLTFKGKFETSDMISGDVEFSSLAGERVSKHGTFKAMRAAK